jgi:hypothetical protein
VPAGDQLSHAIAVAAASKPPAVARQQDADLLEELAHSRRRDLVTPRRVLSVNDPTRKHIRAGREVRAARAPHEQQLPGLLAAH